ncbi:MAG: flagellar motor protein MotB [Candidatus Kapabacteria bacterium]|nr:flagellar motor protein MotB [Ignavibacteriota bacterium]MCW5886101.1 flagellar motor protein MotB [Candidatus Kapabacteria bacterium]
MIRLIILFSTFSLIFVSCVSQGKYDAMVGERDIALSSNDSLKNVISNLNSRNLNLNRELANLQSELNSLKLTYDELKKNSSAGALSMITKLEELQKDIADREKRIEEIKLKLEERDRFLTALRERIQRAMAGVEEGGLSVYVKDGKLYVSLSNKLLFKTGSTVIDKTGLDALLQLAVVLNQQEDINILVEGHTDNQPITAQAGRFKDNWDLSVMRATEVVRYLTVDGKVNPKRIIASGRGEFFPIQDGDSPEERATNRRTEIILTPNIDILFDLFD